MFGLLAKETKRREGVVDDYLITFTVRVPCRYQKGAGCGWSDRTPGEAIKEAQLLAAVTPFSIPGLEIGLKVVPQLLRGIEGG